MTKWKEALADKIDPELRREIDIFEIQIEQRRQNKLDEKVFGETRLRRGVYGQRYDNGQRHDGIQTRTLPYRSDLPSKGIDTVWDAPGMQRIKIPFGGLTPIQLGVMADLAQEYSDGIAHVTTRQDFQFHFIHLEDTPALMRRLAAVRITTMEAAGNVVRNVTACPRSGVCHDEAFDVTPYAQAAARFLLGHPDLQDFGRKFKIAFSGCPAGSCGLANIHDMGLVAKTLVENGEERRGFALLVGGGLGAVPYQARLFTDFLPEEELLPTAQAIGRVFARLGEKKNRARARLKFLVDKLGIEEFRRLVLEERSKLPTDPRWHTFIDEARRYQETPREAPAPLDGAPTPEGFDRWRQTNVYCQKQAGYVTATLNLPLGDISACQLRTLAELAQRFASDHIRTTVDQNILLRWVRAADLPALYQGLKDVGLSDPGAGTIVDVTACPGTDTCRLGISSSRGLAEELRQRLANRFAHLDAAAQGLRIKIGGCFNSCGHHHIADIGFYGVSRTIETYRVPHFQVLLGGQTANNAGAYGLAIGAVPARNIPTVVDRITRRYSEERHGAESFRAFIDRIGKRILRDELADLIEVPPHEEEPSYYADWGDPRQYSLDDIGTGECAGEVVTPLQFGMSAAERDVFEAQISLDEKDFEQAWQLSRSAMLQAAKTLVKEQLRDVPDDPDAIVGEFRKRFYDTKIFFDKYAGGKFANYLFRSFEEVPRNFHQDNARTIIEEAQLFIEAAHACHTRLATAQMPAPVKSPLSKLSRRQRGN